MTVAIDYLDKSTPIQIVKGSDYFDWMCKRWQDSVTIVDLMKREADEKARYAYAIARQTKAHTAPQPTFQPISSIRATGPIPRITDANKTTTNLERIWDEEGERPVANLIRKRGRFGRMMLRVQIFFWEIFS